MSTPTAAQAETAATPAPALPDSTSAAASKFVDAKEAKEKADPKGSAGAGAGSTGSDARGAKPGSQDKAKPRIDPNLIKREREATEALARAKALEAKFQPLEEKLVKKDIRGAMELLAKDHNVSFADFVEILRSSGDEDESVEKKAARVARETIDQLKAAEDEKKRTEDARKAEEETKVHQQRVEGFRGRLQTMAEGDADRWPTASVQGTGGKGWEALVAFDEAGARITGDDATQVALDVVEEAHDLVKSHFKTEKKRLDLDKAIQLVVGELAKLGADGARAKLKEARNPIAAGNARNEAGGQANGGRAAEPRINNRTTSGGSGVAPERDANAPVTFGKSAVDDALRRLPALAARVQ